MHRPDFPPQHPGPHPVPLRNINHKEDFPLPLTLRDSKGMPLRIPDYDFTVRLTAGPVEYFAGRFDGRLVNCRPAKHDYCTLVIFCADHHFPPCPELMAEITYHVPDADYGHRGYRNIVRRQPTGICLTVQRSDLPGWADFDGLPEHSCECDTISQNEIDDMWIRLQHPPHHHHHHGCHHHHHRPERPGRPGQPGQSDKSDLSDLSDWSDWSDRSDCPRHPEPTHESISPHDLDSIWQRLSAENKRP